MPEEKKNNPREALSRQTDEQPVSNQGEQPLEADAQVVSANDSVEEVVSKPENVVSTRADTKTDAKADVNKPAPEKPTKRTTDKRIKPSNEKKRKKERRKRALKTLRNTLIVLFVLVVICLVVGFWALRWGLHDDSYDLEGQWHIHGSEETIQVTDGKLIFTEDISYDYVINPESKTLSFKFGALEGTARYRFSLNRKCVAIEDGEFGWFDTFLADIPWTLEAVGSEISGGDDKSPEFSAGGMVLERIE